MPGHHHRSGGLKQSNKKNKRTKASKRSLNRLNGGRVNPKIASIRNSHGQSKADRRHAQLQRRIASRKSLLEKKRGIVVNGIEGTLPPPPRVVGLIGLGENAGDLERRVRDKLIAAADRVIQNEDGAAFPTVQFDVHKKEGALSLLTNCDSFRPHYQCQEGGGDNQSLLNDDDAAVMGALDLCRVCELVLFLFDGNQADDSDTVLGMSIGGDDDDDDNMSVATKAKSTMSSTTQQQRWDHLVSARGDRILSAIKTQGLPTPLTLLIKTAPDEDELFQVDDGALTMKSAKSVRRSALKRRLDLKKYVTRFATTEFGADQNKVMELNLFALTSPTDASDVLDELDSSKKSASLVSTNEKPKRNTDVAALVRSLCQMSAQGPKWVSAVPRPFLLAESREYNREKRELSLTGHVRGSAPLCIHSLIHIPGMGTFALKSATEIQEPPLLALKRLNNQRKRHVKDTRMTIEGRAMEADPMKRENLDFFAVPDALQGEQNLIGFDEDDEQYDEDDDGLNLEKAARPAGWSDYQSSWLDAVDDMDSVAQAGDVDHGELAAALNARKSSAGSVATANNMMDLDDEDNEISEEQRQRLMEERRKNQSEELDFPDEVQVMEDENARDRFARYRSLKSFRKSHWDPNENLPESYARIYHLRNFRATQRDVLGEQEDRIEAARRCHDKTDGPRYFWGGENQLDNNGVSETILDEQNGEESELLKDCIPAGSYISIVLEAVSEKVYNQVSGSGVMVGASLLEHEQKVSVLHVGLMRKQDSLLVDGNPDELVDGGGEIPVKSKDVLTFRCGWRTWIGRPIFSQHNLNSDKHKFERYMPSTGAYFAASVFGPLTYTPCPTLVFRGRQVRHTTERSETNPTHKVCQELVATGSMLNADANRIVVKRIVLTGYPVRVRKRHAVVKYMFYNPEDVRWFKPAGLWTKHGLQGHIVESNGDHGTMKCLFNAPIQQHDTVCLPLYKRVFPKFVNTQSSKGDDGMTVKSMLPKEPLVVL